MSRSPGVPTPDALEARIAELRAAVRRAMAAGDRTAARELRAELRHAEEAWDDAVLGTGADAAETAPRETAPRRSSGRSSGRPRGAATGKGERATGSSGGAAGSQGKVRAKGPAKRGTKGSAKSSAKGSGRGSRRGLLPVREQVHQALTLLGVPSAPKLVGSVYAAFFPGEIAAGRLTSLRRDEERSFRTAPYARPYYLCAALTADLLAPARGLLTVSTWPLERRIVGPLSPRTDFLTSAIRLAEHAGRGEPNPEAQRLLWRFASNIPGAVDGTVGTVDPAVLAEAARGELEVHREADRRRRESAAGRALDRLDDAERLFGSRLRALQDAPRRPAVNGETDR
ncbi:hypothetical protein [Actinomadura sp. WMMB 499]|uniref:hypothetical protein n=1 Tax=Actinomadura sp. WMMB 499 TaxID=1219491 RepID=UPI0012441B4A|nr:hypothetical protein [Actinomadura sp. WMMB 499]QFG26323.1 hypothetical protein F7P10_39465 [Actinomadura sp. WMMB 499]